MFFIVLWISLVAVVNAEISCPSRCTCEGSRLECYHMMPNFIPKSATVVIVHETALDNNFNFSDPGWENVTHLSINPFFFFHLVVQRLRMGQRYTMINLFH